MRINFLDKLLFCLFKRYTIGVNDGFNWKNKYN